MTKEEEDKLTIQLIEAFTEVVKTIQLGGKRKGVYGSIVCPRCGGELKFSTSSYNGHIRGACTTEDCLSWIQ